jgi:hypothetical protein
MSQAGAYIPSIGFSPNKFTLHNASPEPLTFRWAGLQFTLPAVDEVGKSPALDADGQPIPGSLILQDGYSVDRDGNLPAPGSPPNWSAFDAIRNVLGVDPNTKQATGVMAKAGVSFLPNTPSKDLIEKVREDGKRRYAESQVDWAQYTVSAYESRVAAARAVGQTAAPPDQDYAKAIQILKRHQARLAQDNKIEEIPGDEEIRLKAFIEAEAMEMAKEAAAGKDVDKAALAEKLMQDPKVRAYLGRKYSIRQRGYVGVPEVPEGD